MKVDLTDALLFAISASPKSIYFNHKRPVPATPDSLTQSFRFIMLIYLILKGFTLRCKSITIPGHTNGYFFLSRNIILAAFKLKAIQQK